MAAIMAQGQDRRVVSWEPFRSCCLMFSSLAKTAPTLAEIPYRPDAAVLFEPFADRPWSAFLDSAGAGRYDIVVAEPVALLITRGPETEIVRDSGREVSRDDPFVLMRRLLASCGKGQEGPPARAPSLPFAGGALGYFAYDLGRRIETLPAIARDEEGFPDMAVGIYDWAIVVDHRESRAWLVSAGRDERTRDRWESLLAHCFRPEPPRAREPFRVLGPVASNFTRRRYAEAVQRILDYIRAGDCYQVNLAQRFSVAVDGDPWLLYWRLRAVNPAPFSAYLATPWGQVLSCSPEQFLEVRGRRVQTKPVKGTRPRSPEPGEDAALREALRASPKDRAENVMIVDLLRNDLGKSCAIGSVRVPKLCEVESFATVHHLVSTVTGTLAPGKDALDLLRGCFPGGSITGAPKLRAMEIIEELEPHRRGIYCGSIGYIGFDGAMDTNIAIRTLVISGGRARFWAGGGIVADSDWRSEYQETLDKAAAFFTALEREPPA